MRNYNFKDLKVGTIDIIGNFFATHSIDTPFTANEIGLHDSQCAYFVRAKIFEVVGSVEVWYKINEDTMRRGKAKVYKLLEMPDCIREAVLLSKIENIIRKVTSLKIYTSENIKKYENEISKLNAMR